MENYKTTPFITKFEFCKIVGMRALELSLKKDGKETSSNLHEIAKKELIDGKIDMCIRRHLPNGRYEDRNIKDLQIDFYSLY